MDPFPSDWKKEAGEYIILTGKGSNSFFLPGTVTKKPTVVAIIMMIIDEIREN